MYNTHSAFAKALEKHLLQDTNDIMHSYFLLVAFTFILTLY